MNNQVLKLGQCNIDINHDWMRLRTTFDDGAFTEIWAQDTEEFRDYAQQCGYRGDLEGIWRHFREHDLLHTWLSVKLGLPYSLTLWTVAHSRQHIYSKITNKSQGIEEWMVTEFQKFLNNLRDGASPPLDWFVKLGYNMEELKKEGLEFLQVIEGSKL